MRALYISVAASFSTNHHWRHRMGSSKLHPKNAIELWGRFLSKLPNYFHILREIIVLIKCILKHLDPIYTSVLIWGTVQARIVLKYNNIWRILGSPIRNKCTQNKVKVKFDEQTKFEWNNISIIATVPGVIMLRTLTDTKLGLGMNYTWRLWTGLVMVERWTGLRLCTSKVTGQEG